MSKIPGSPFRFRNGPVNPSVVPRKAVQPFPEIVPRPKGLVVLNESGYGAEYSFYGGEPVYIGPGQKAWVPAPPSTEVDNG